MEVNYQYRAARILDFEVDPSSTIWLPKMNDIVTLEAMKEADDAFSKQLETNGKLCKLFVHVMQEATITADLVQRTEPRLRSLISMLEEGLKNRVNFAIQQKERVLLLQEAIEPDSEKRRVIEEANADLHYVLLIISDWNSKSICQLHAEGTICCNKNPLWMGSDLDREKD